MFQQMILRDVVSPSNNVREDDTIETKKALQRVGKYEPPKWGISGYPDQKMFDGLEKLQRENGLTPDRTMKPKGPTHRALRASLDRSAAVPSPKPLKLSGPVGPAAANPKPDVKKVRSSLAGLNYLPKPERQQPKDHFDDKAASALGAFQLDYNLKWDRLAKPDGPTIRRLDMATAPLRTRGKVTLPNDAPTPASTANEAPDQNNRKPDLSPRTPLEAARRKHLTKLADELRQGRALNEPDEMLGETVLESYGDRLNGLSAPTAAKLFKLSVQAENDPDTADILDAVHDPDFPVRRGRFTLANGDVVTLSQDEAHEGASGGDGDVRLARADPSNPAGKFGEIRSGIGLFSGILGGISGGPRGRSGTVRNEASEHEDKDEGSANLPVPRPDKNSEVNSPEPPDDDNNNKRPTPPKNAPVKLDDDLELPVSDKSGRANRRLPGRIYNAIGDEKGKRVLGELLDGKGTITTKGKGETMVNVDVDLPAEAAEKLIEDVAAQHDMEPIRVEEGKSIYKGPDGTIWMARPRSSEKGSRGAEVRVQLPAEGGAKESSIKRSMKMTFGKSGAKDDGDGR